MVWDLTIRCLFVIGLTAITFQATADDLRFEVRGNLSLDSPSIEVETADTLAQKSRTLLSDCIVHSGCLDDATPERAEALARRALEKDPSHTEARLQLAISLSMQARHMSLGEARKSKVAEKMRDFAEAVLKDDPDNAWAHGFLAVWHVEVRRRGGAIGAAIMGASLRQAETHFNAVTRLAPDNLVLRWQYARALAALDSKRHDDEILSELSVVSERPCRDALEQAVQKRAIRLAETIQHREFDAAEQFANTQM